MHLKSPHPPLDIPKTSILDFIYPPDASPPDFPLWIDAKDPSFFLTPKSARQWICRLGQGLERKGIKAGDVCLVFTPNHIFVPVAYLGIVSMGAIFSGLNPSYTVDEAAFQISNTGAKLMLVHPTLVHTAIEAAKRTVLSTDMLFLFGDQESEPLNGIQDWRSMLSSPADADLWKWKSLSPEQAVKQVATLNFSSGTTGLPKGVCISHHSLIANVCQLQIAYDLSKPKRWIDILPLYHAYGQCFYILIAAKYRIPVLIMKAFVFEEFLKTIETQRITSLQVVPPIMIMLDKRPEVSKYDLSSVTEIVCGAAPLSRELQQAVATKLGVRVTQAYGATETTCGLMCSPWGLLETPIGSVGLIVPNTEIKLLDDDGRDVAIGERGEIYARGPQIALGYWRNEKSTLESFDSEGWYRTGDVGMVDKKGFFWILDRKKELIKVKGLQVSPAEVEAVLLENPDVADAGVVGIKIGNNEWPRAYVKLKDGAEGRVGKDQIFDWVKWKLSRHKWLIGGVVFVDEVPRLASGKLARKTLRQWAERDAKTIEATDGVATPTSKL